MITLLLHGKEERRMKRLLADEYCMLHVVTSNNKYHIKVQLLNTENTKRAKYSSENRDSSHTYRHAKLFCAGVS